MQEQWIVFRVAGELYCHSVASVKEILRYEEPTPVPGAPDAVAGILNVRGEVITVLSARRMMELAAGVTDDNWRVIVLETGIGYYGIIVDGVDEIIRFAAEQIDGIGSSGNSPQDKLIIGTVNLDDTLYIPINFIDYCLQSVDNAEVVH